jgi:ATP-dependent Clp protease adapter protein ClpS
VPDINPSHLPQKPDLAQERKRAKDLLKALCTGDRQAIARFRSHHPRFADLTADTLRPTDVQLSDAQWVIAREYGFPSWPALKAHIEQVPAGSTTVAPMHRVLMWNDDNTPMEFVCYLLETLFEMDAEKAKQIMLDVHHRGVRVCGVYDRQQDAVAKVAAATKLARERGHQLRVTYAYGNAGMLITPMVYIPTTDDDITAAIAKARATLPAFWASYEARKPSETGHHLKVRFPTPRDDALRRPLAEHIWISAVRRLANGSYSGQINRCHTICREKEKAISSSLRTLTFRIGCSRVTARSSEARPSNAS